MKKLLIVLTCLAIILLAGCAASPVRKTQIGDNKSIVIVASGDETTIDNNTTLADYLLKLKDKKELVFEAEDGLYGLFITSMDGTENEETATANTSEGYSWNVYIDFLVFDGVPYANDGIICEYDGKTLYSAIYGISSIPCLKGHTYAFVYEHYQYSW